MESCLLCLEMSSDTVHCIKTESIKWQKLKIADILEKHFWAVNYSRSSSFICSSCWQTVGDFHRFYVGIEKAHMNFKKIKVEKEEIIDFYVQETDMSLAEKVQLQDNKQNIKTEETMTISSIETHQGAHMNFKTLETTIISSGETSEDFTTEVKNETIVTNYEAIRSAVDCDTDSEVSDDDDNYQEIDSSNTENSKKRPASLFNYKCRKNDEFIVANFKNMNCDLCQKPFTDFYGVKKHFTDEHNQRGYLVCCKRKFYDRFHLVDHIHLHLNPNYFKCNHCGKTMSNRRTIKSHILNEHMESTHEKKHLCDKCDVSFNDEYFLQLHKSVHLPEDEKEFPCSNCSETYKSFHLLFQHMKADHLKKFFKTCYACGKTLVCARDFEVHINTHLDRRITQIYCDICGLGLTSEDGLKRHQRNQHPVDGKKDYHCPNCPKISPTLRALQKHIRTIHEANLSFECEICGKTFKRKSVLKEHMAVHTGTPLYTCPWCPKMYKSSSNMFAHRKKVHPKEWEKVKLQKYSEEFQPIIASTAQK